MKILLKSCIFTVFILSIISLVIYDFFQVRLKYSKPDKVILIGLDGATWKVMQPLIDQGRLPNIAKLINNGAVGVLESIEPMNSPILWTTIVTGKSEKKHGISDFVTKTPGEYETSIVTSNLRKVKAIWNILSDYGKTVGIVNWWASWPAEKVNGFIVSERVCFWDSYHPLENPQFIRNFSGLTYPNQVLSKALQLKELSLRDLDKEVTQLLGYRPFSPPLTPLKRFQLQSDPVNLNSLEYNEKIAASLVPLIISRDISAVKIGHNFLNQYKPNLFAVYLWGIDGFEHLFCEFSDENYNLNIAQEHSREPNQLVHMYYQFTDRLIGELLADIDENTTVIIVSDHGFYAVKNQKEARIFNFNFIFEKLGYLNYKNGEIDWLNTKVYDYTKGNNVYSDNEYQLSLNVRGREHKGIINPGKEYDETRQGIKQGLENIKTIDNQKIFEVKIPEVLKKTEGRQLPDLIVKIQRHIPFDTKCLIAGQVYPVTKFILPKTWRSGHDKEGIIIMSGTHIKKGSRLKDASVVDITPTILELLGIPLGRDMDGKVLSKAITEQYLASHPIHYVDSHEDKIRFKPHVVSKSSFEEEMKEMLRSLGYIQ
jgi:predicted AlkP superfamily phosphohydrolase/phosphomutase